MVVGVECLPWAMNHHELQARPLPPPHASPRRRRACLGQGVSHQGTLDSRGKDVRCPAIELARRLESWRSGPQQGWAAEPLQPFPWPPVRDMGSPSGHADRVPPDVDLAPDRS